MVNWRLALPVLGEAFDCLAPDLVGFAASEHPAALPVGVRPWLDLWVQQIVGLLDAVRIETPHLVGNSLGGAIALHLAHRHPKRFERIALMGPLRGHGEQPAHAFGVHWRPSGVRSVRISGLIVARDLTSS